MSNLCINIFKLIQNLPELTLAYLEYDLLLLFFSSFGLIFLQVHLDIQSWLFQSFCLFGRYLDIHSPVKVSKLWQASELILIVRLGTFRHFSHHLKDESSHLFGECFREFSCEFIFVL